MNRTSLALFAALLLGTAGAGVVAWRHMGDLQLEVGELRGSVAALSAELRAAGERAEAAEARAAEADSRASKAAELAERMTARAQVAEQQASADRDLAASAAGEAEAARAQSQETMARAEQAFLEAERAKRAAAELRRRREQEIERVAQALAKVAETRRTEDGVVANLGRGIEFDTDQAVLRPRERELLSRIAGILITAGDLGVQVFGHTDDVGNADYNQKLSERRARSVREYLVAAGVRPEVISATGMGKSRPLVRGTDAASRQRNRRVEIAVVHSAGEPALDVPAETAGR